MPDPSPQQTYVFSLDAVHRAIASLTSQPIHEHFPGYLAVLRAKAADPGIAAASSDIAELHDRYLRVVGAPDSAPFVRPFKSRGKGLEQINPNVAGSYGPGSIRKSLTLVVEVDGVGQNARYKLREGHAELALKHLLRGKRVSALALAAFLYRDYGFELSDPTADAVLGLFRQEFAFRSNVAEEAAAFDTLFDADTAIFQEDDLQLLASVTQTDE